MGTNENKYLLFQAAISKGPTNLLGPNVHHLLRLTHLTNMTSLPPLWTALERYPKMQHLAMLKDALDSAADALSAWVTTVATPGMPKRLLGLQLCMEDREYLKTGVQPFTFWQHIIAVRKALAACDPRHALIVGGGAATSLDDAKTLTALDSATTPSTLVALRGMITHLCVVADRIFGVSHITTSAMGKCFDKIVARKDEIGKAMAWDARRSRKLPGLIIFW